ncbi:MAG TPA: hypothetical protein V6D17_01245 [Candidatus Obscuribacterales bacterium]
MREELILALAADFPQLFGCDAKAGSSYLRGVACGDGWEPLIRRLCGQIEQLISAVPEEEQQIYKLIEIRERHGGLEFYMNDATSDMRELIAIAVAESFKICEFCGANGQLRQSVRRGSKTLCDGCRAKIVPLPMTARSQSVLS